MTELILNEKEINFNTLEKKIFKEICRVGCEVLKNILEQLDKNICEERDKKEYRHKGKRKTVLKTLMGEVEYSRAVYEHKNEEGKKEYIYLLDEEIGLDTVGKISTNLAEKIVENVSLVSYRNAAKNVTELTGQTISHGGAWNIVQKLGEKIKEDEEEQIQALKENKIKGKKTRKIIFEEADGVWLNIQGEDKPKKGKKREMKVAVAYEGWKKVGKERYELVNKTLCAGFEESKTFYKKKEAMIAREYDIDEIEIRILNGDGASWISDGIDGTVQYQLDPFHKYQAVVRNVQDKEERAKIIELLRVNKIKETMDHITKLLIEATKEEDKRKEEKLTKLFNYFANNREWLVPYNKRDIKLPELPKGIVYRNLGTMEHQICDTIAQRMKHKKASWSIKGAGNLGKILAAKKSGKLNQIINKFSRIILSEEKAEEIIEILSASKAPKKDGKGVIGRTQRGLIPFTNCTLTNGRKSIRNMFNYRNI